MLILSLDSTAQTASVALSDNDKLLAGAILNIGNKHSTTLLPAAAFVLEQAGVQANDIELFAVTAGPGSFTGVRIGTAAVKGLALGREVPCIGVSSLETMAVAIPYVDGVICPMINARRDRYFTAFFSSRVCDGKRAVTRLSDDDVLHGDEIDEYIHSRSEPVWLMGDGSDVYLKNHTPDRSSPITVLTDPIKHPFAYYAGVIAMNIYDNADDEKRLSFTAESLRPIYLRQPQAERELEERLNNQK